MKTAGVARGVWWLVPVLGVSGVLSLSLGAYALPLWRSLGLIGGALAGGVEASVEASVLFSIRLPRVLFGMLAGAGLALGGLCMQALFRNPLADPGLLGLSSGAALAAAGITLLSPVFPAVLGQPAALPLAAFAGGLLATGVVYRVSSRGGTVRVDAMLLTGIAVNALCGALIGLLLVVADDAQLRNVTFWSFGSLGRTDLRVSGLLVLAFVPAVVWMWGQREEMNLLLMGEAEAVSLGVDVQGLKRRLVVLSCWMVSLVVALAGLIGFVGLVIPHVARLLFGASHRSLMPATLLLGAAFLPLADTLCRTAAAPAEIPVGVVTSLLGTPFFLLLLVRRRAA